MNEDRKVACGSFPTMHVPVVSTRWLVYKEFYILRPTAPLFRTYRLYRLKEECNLVSSEQRA